MRSAMHRWIGLSCTACIPLVAVSGCDDSGFGANEIVSIIFAAGDVALAIIRAVT